jgi:hypothetical protein
VYEYNYMAHERYKVASSETLTPGPATVRLDFKYDGGGVGKGATATLFINDKKVGETRIDKSVPGRFGPDTFDVGRDNGSPVSEEYQPPFPYAGAIKKVQVHITPSTLSASDEEKVRNAKWDAAIAIE